MALSVKVKYNKRWESQENPALEATIARMTQTVETEAKRRAPYITGNLRRSISSAVTGKGKNTVGIVKATAFYAAFVEFGTSRHAPNPFLRNALASLKRGPR